MPRPIAWGFHPIGPVEEEGRRKDDTTDFRISNNSRVVASVPENLRGECRKAICPVLFSKYFPRHREWELCVLDEETAANDAV